MNFKSIKRELDSESFRLLRTRMEVESDERSSGEMEVQKISEKVRQVRREFCLEEAE